MKRNVILVFLFLTLICLFLTLNRSMTDGYVFNIDIRLIRQKIYIVIAIDIIYLKFLRLWKSHFQISFVRTCGRIIAIKKFKYIK